ncbi:carbon-nitrogen hydrolase family protein [Rhizobium leguminosarum]
MKIAAAQTAVASNIADNGHAIRALISSAAGEGVRLINFCEGALSGYGKFQIKRKEDWKTFDWTSQETELRAIAELCSRHRIFAVVGGAHRLSDGLPPHNCLYVFSDNGTLLTRYDKRFLSNSELDGWYTPGTEPITFDVDGYRFGCSICIESQFPEVFSEYERLQVDGVLFSSLGIPEYFQIALRAHAGLNCIWISGAPQVQKSHKGPACIIGPDGNWVARCPASAEPGLTVADIDRDDPLYDIALQKARPWRKRARLGDIYRERIVDDHRSRNRKGY